jgi:hypothetical protein
LSSKDFGDGALLQVDLQVIIINKYNILDNNLYSRNDKYQEAL